jgi:hypothetical protein
MSATVAADADGDGMMTGTALRNGDAANGAAPSTGMDDSEELRALAENAASNDADVSITIPTVVPSKALSSTSTGRRTIRRDGLGLNGAIGVGNKDSGQKDETAVVGGEGFSTNTVDASQKYVCPCSGRWLTDPAASTYSSTYEDGRPWDRETLLLKDDQRNVVAMPDLSKEVEAFLKRTGLPHPDEFATALGKGDLDFLNGRPFLPRWLQPNGLLTKSAVSYAAKKGAWASIKWLLEPKRNAYVPLCAVKDAVMAPTAHNDALQKTVGVTLLLHRLTEARDSVEGAEAVAAAVRIGSIEILSQLLNAGFPKPTADVFQDCPSVEMAQHLFQPAIGLSAAAHNFKPVVLTAANPKVWEVVWNRACAEHPDLINRLDILRIVLLASFRNPSPGTVSAVLNASPALRAACARAEPEWLFVPRPDAAPPAPAESASASSSATAPKKKDAKDKDAVPSAATVSSSATAAASALGAAAADESSSILIRFVQEVRTHVLPRFIQKLPPPAANASANASVDSAAPPQLRQGSDVDAVLAQLRQCCEKLVREGGCSVTLAVGPARNTALHWGSLPMSHPESHTRLPAVPASLLILLSELRTPAEKKLRAATESAIADEKAQAQPPQTGKLWTVCNANGQDAALLAISSGEGAPVIRTIFKLRDHENRVHRVEKEKIFERGQLYEREENVRVKEEMLRRPLKPRPHGAEDDEDGLAAHRTDLHDHDAVGAPTPHTSPTPLRRSLQSLLSTHTPAPPAAAAAAAIFAPPPPSLTSSLLTSDAPAVAASASVPPTAPKSASATANGSALIPTATSLTAEDGRTEPAPQPQLAPDGHAAVAAVGQDLAPAATSKPAPGPPPAHPKGKRSAPAAGGNSSAAKRRKHAVHTNVAHPPADNAPAPATAAATTNSATLLSTAESRDGHVA